MSDLVWFLYVVVGGFVAGKVVHWLVTGDDALTLREHAPGLAVAVMLAWLAWPLAWGFLRAASKGQNGATP